MPDGLEQLYRQRLEIDPYANAEYVADAVGDPPLQFQSGDSGGTYLARLNAYADTIWRVARQALNYWSPERVEQEAYVRAADSPRVSKIALEVARFQVIYERWTELVQEFIGRAHLMEGSRSNLLFRRDSILETLLALERRAQVAEARATDLRLRYEFDKLRAIVTGRALASEIASLIEEAVKLHGAEATIVERYAPKLARLEQEMRDTKLDVQFVADVIGDEFVRRQLTRATVAPVAAKLAEWFVAPGMVSSVLGFLAKLAQ